MLVVNSLKLFYPWEVLGELLGYNYTLTIISQANENYAARDDRSSAKLVTTNQEYHP